MDVRLGGGAALEARVSELEGERRAVIREPSVERAGRDRRDVRVLLVAVQRVAAEVLRAAARDGVRPHAQERDDDSESGDAEREFRHA
jgi:hypothetical protein